MPSTLSVVVIATAIVLAAGWFWLKKRGLRRMPAILKPGSPLPDFQACDEQDNPLRSAELRGTPAVILFVRGNWCPFCSTQVKDLTKSLQGHHRPWSTADFDYAKAARNDPARCEIF